MIFIDTEFTDFKDAQLGSAASMNFMQNFQPIKASATTLYIGVDLAATWQGA